MLVYKKYTYVKCIFLSLLQKIHTNVDEDDFVKSIKIIVDNVHD